MSGVSIKYGDFAPEAKENFTPSSSSAKYNTLQQLQFYNLNFPNYGNPIERYSVLLDGGAVPFPSEPENANIGLVSNELSGADGIFTPAIMLELTSTGQYSSQGLTLTFDTYNNIFCNSLNIKWYRNGELLFSEDYTPTSAFYFCEKQVENFDNIVITFNSLNMPENRLKLRAIDYGYGTIFYGDELRAVKCIQEINPISSEISINTVDFTLDSKRDVNYSFQAKQPLSVYFNDELKATTFVKSSKRKSKTLWDVQSEDYIGVMDSVPYRGGIYTNALAVDILADIFSVAKVPYSVSEEFANKTVTGHIPYTTCREALMQVAFAIQAVVDTSDSEVVKIYTLDNTVKQTVPLDRIMQGQNFVDEETATSVEVVQHTFTPITDTVEAYKSADSGTGQGILVKFSEPLHDLEIINGTITNSGANYAVINANNGCVMRGKKYEHVTTTKELKNPVVLASEIEKVVGVENATLVSSANVDVILDRCYEWLTKTSQTNLSIVEGKHVSGGEDIPWGGFSWGSNTWSAKVPLTITYDTRVSVGDTLKAETEYLGEVEGIVTSQKFNLNGNIIVKEAVLR